MIDWSAWTTQPASPQRAWNIGTDLVALPGHDLRDLSSELLRAALNYAYLMPENGARGQAEAWTADAVQRALDGDGAAGERLVAHFSGRAKAAGTAADRSTYWLLLAAFALADGQPLTAISSVAPLLAEVDPLPTPVRLEAVTLAWCVAMTAMTVAEHGDDDLLRAGWNVNQAGQRVADVARTQYQASIPGSEEGDLLAIIGQLMTVLFACAGSLAMFGGHPDLFQPSAQAFTEGQRLEEITGGNWPVLPWVHRFYSHGAS